MELKAWADDLNGLRKKVEKIAKLKEEIIQEDIYFAFANTKGYQKQRFRLRKCGMQSIVTVKLEGKACPGVEANREFEFEVSDPEGFKVFCQQFGFRVLISKKKIVRKYLYLPAKKEFYRPSKDGVIIELNQVEGLGDFIEIEAMVDHPRQIRPASRFLKSLLKKLGVPASQIEPTPYTELLYKKLFA